MSKWTSKKSFGNKGEKYDADQPMEKGIKLRFTSHPPPFVFLWDFMDKLAVKIL